MRAPGGRLEKRSREMSRGRASFQDREITPQEILQSGVRDGYFSAEDEENEASTSPARGRRRASLSIQIPPTQTSADMAFTALQYLPMPVLVLSSAKTIVLANEAMARLLGVDNSYEHEYEDAEEDTLSRIASREVESPSDVLHGATLAQLGLDLIQNGNPVFVAWEDFLETLVNDASAAQSLTTQLNTDPNRDLEYETTPTDTTSHASLSHASGARTKVHDAVVEVLFSTHRDSKTGLPLVSRHDAGSHVQAQMIISVWATEDEQYFTLTFTASGEGSSPSQSAKSTSRTVSRASTSLTTSLDSGLSSNSSNSSGRRKSTFTTSPPTSAASNVTSPRIPPPMEFPPKGPPAKSSVVSEPTMFSKTSRLKDAILDGVSIPAYAMWKDESFGIPNKAAIKLIYPWIEAGAYDTNEQARDFLAKFVLYKEDFSAEIPLEDFPISRLMREQEKFDGYRVGLYSAKDGSRLMFDAVGEPLTDGKGEFLGGLVTFLDVTNFARTINRQQKQNEEQFENVRIVSDVISGGRTSYLG